MLQVFKKVITLSDGRTIEIETGKSREPLEESIEAVRQKSIWLKDLGRFPVLEK